ncbi:CAP domain-containing protein [Polyangium aurulentum]|uniref:CAP domain-containing protein n=1 Tax=Polyangium aurulentum TaxID=2567896 RepID=UPI00113DE0D1|nr:CAP domain-containing protein [Polyangium aurulentum]UQA63349.1 hypothetical protein E8A73_023930 [Polyangium aurulentum]
MQMTRLCSAFGLVFAVGLVGCLEGRIGGDESSIDNGSGAGGVSVGPSGSGGSVGQGGAGQGGAGQGGAGQGGAGQGGAGQGGSGPASSSSSATTGSSGGGADDVAQKCVDLINQHRASIGLPPYERWMEAEACSDDEAKKDSETGMAHGAFGQCTEFAQNECPGWPGAPDDIIAPCLQAMWNEGPGDDFNKHGHYINMSSTSYTKVACGFWTTANGSVWAVQNFR